MLPIAGVVCGVAVLIFAPHSSNEGGSRLRTAGEAIDIAWGLKVDADSFSKQEKTLINTLGGVDAWVQSQADCMNSAMLLLDNVLNSGKHWGVLSRRSTSTDIQSLWFEHVTQNFDVFIGGRVCRMRGLISLGSDFPQSPTVSYRIENMSNYYLAHLGLASKPQLVKESFIIVGGNYLNNYGKSLLGKVLANPLLFMALIILRAYRRKSHSRREFLLIALTVIVVLSIFIGGVGYEPRYVWPATALLILALLTDIPQLSYRKIQSQRQ